MSCEDLAIFLANLAYSLLDKITQPILPDPLGTITFLWGYKTTGINDKTADVKTENIRG